MRITKAQWVLLSSLERRIVLLYLNYAYIKCAVLPSRAQREPVQISTHRNGKDHITHKWVPDPTLKPLVQKAWQMRAAGASYVKIKKETGLYKSTNSYTTFFRNKLYIGILEFGELTIENYCEPIIDLKTWEDVQKLNSKNQRPAPMMHPRRKGSSFLLSGLVYCSLCGSPYNGHVIASRDGKTYKYYRCSQSHRNRDCPAPMINKEDLEKAILLEISENILDPENIKLLQESAQKDLVEQRLLRESELDVFKGQIGPVKQKINNVTEAIAEVGHSDALLRRLENLETELYNLNLRIQELEIDQSLPASFPDPDEISEKIKTVLANASQEDKKIILQGLIHRIDAQRIKEKGIMRGTITFILPSSLGEKQKAPLDEEPSENIYVYTKCPHGDTMHKHNFLIQA